MDYSFLKPIISPSLGMTGSTDSLSSLANLLTKTTDKSSSTSSADFKDILSMMLNSLSNNNSMASIGFGDSSEDDSSSLLGFSSSMLMMPLMIALMEKIMALDAQGQVSSSLSSIGHLNQCEADVANGVDGINADCGPTSLVMALHALGLKVPGEDKASTSGEVIDLARTAMVSDPARDGVDESGQRSDSEHNTFTNFDDLVRGARAAGATVTTLTPNATSIRNALESGARVIVSGTFTGKTPVPWTGDRGVDAATAPGFATDHIIAVTGYDEKSGQFTVNDPARSKPFTVGSGTLMYFMEGNPGALALTT
jgi:hypothetical protein